MSSVQVFGKLYKPLVPGEGFEPPTFGLQNRCTATVLTRLSEAHHSTSKSCVEPAGRRVAMAKLMEPHPWEVLKSGEEPRKFVRQALRL
jgi:hypothetical protein